MSSLALPTTSPKHALQALADQRIEHALEQLEAQEINTLCTQNTNAFYDCCYFTINNKARKKWLLQRLCQELQT